MRDPALPRAPPFPRTIRATTPPNEEQRLAAVRRYGILDTPPDGALDRVTRIAARIFGVPISVVSLVDSDRIWFKSHHGTGVDETERAPGLCASAILQDAPCVVTDALADSRTRTNPLRAELGLRFYAGVPLRTKDGHNLGTLNVIDTKPRQASDGELAILEDLAGIVVDDFEARLAARVEEQRLNRERAEFIVTASHELKTPLAAVYGAAKLLAKPGIDARRREKLIEVIAEEAERLSSVVGEILTGARLEAGGIEIARTHFDPDDVAAAAVESAATHLPANLTLEHIRAGVPLEIESDAGKVQQILAGLIENAVKYSPEGGLIEVAVQPREGGVRLIVSDDGVGVPEADRERIFGRFIRLNGDPSRGVGGTGLGLYIARELAGMLGGSLECQPPTAAGATFVLDLPVIAPPADELH
jgi:signal transduction histidine kinase